MNINEIFTSLSGEPDGFSNQGGLATFVRLQGCNLDCIWCDTKRATLINTGYNMSVEEVAKQCTDKHVIITGGEPLLQAEEVAQLVELLCPGGRKDHLITVETNGSVPLNLEAVRTRFETLRYVVDYKLDSSGMNSAMIKEVFDSLSNLDVIKFVIKDLQDYRQAVKTLYLNPDWLPRKVFSPILNGKWAPRLAVEMMKDKLEGVTLALQWQKLLGLK